MEELETRLDWHVYLQGMAILTEALNLKSENEAKADASLRLRWEFLKDLPNELYEAAVREIVMNTRGTYPIHNLIGEIRFHAGYFATPRLLRKYYEQGQAKGALESYEKNRHLGIV